MELIVARADSQNDLTRSGPDGGYAGVMLDHIVAVPHPSNARGGQMNRGDNVGGDGHVEREASRCGTTPRDWDPSALGHVHSSYVHRYERGNVHVDSGRTWCRDADTQDVILKNGQHGRAKTVRLAVSSLASVPGLPRERRPFLQYLGVPGSGGIGDGG